MSTYLIHPTEEQEKVVRAFFEALDISFVKEDEVLPDYVLEGIIRGQEDVKVGRTIGLDEFKKRMLSTK